MGNNVWNAALGIWEDTETGNQFINGTWKSPTGLTFVNGVWGDPTAKVQNAQGATLAAKQGVIGAQGQQISAGYASNAAQQAMLPYQAATLNAKRNVLGAQQATMPAQQAVLGANQAVVGAQGAQLAGSRELIAKNQAENATQKSEYAQFIAAQNNTQDQAAVATMKRYNAAKDARARSLGMVPEAEVSVPVGSTAALAPGLRAAPTTQAEDVARTTSEAQKNRGFDLQAAQLAVQLMGTNVDQARLEAAKAGLTLDQAQLMVKQAEIGAGFAGNAEDVAGLSVSQAKLAEDRAGLGVSQARLGEAQAGLDEDFATLELNRSKRPPIPGAELHTDPYTGKQTYMTPSEADQLDFQYQLTLGTERTLPKLGAQQQQEQLLALAKGEGGFNTPQAQQAIDSKSIGELLNMYLPPNAYEDNRWPAGYLEASNAAEQAIVRKLMADKTKNLTMSEAQAGAKQLINLEMIERAKAEAEKNRRPTTSPNSSAPPP